MGIGIGGRVAPDGADMPRCGGGFGLLLTLSSLDGLFSGGRVDSAPLTGTGGASSSSYNGLCEGDEVLGGRGRALLGEPDLGESGVGGSGRVPRPEA